MWDEKNKIKDTTEGCMLNLWQHMHRNGVEFFIDGEIVLPVDAVSKAVREDGAYMTDYVLGEKGKVKQIRLDKVNCE